LLHHFIRWISEISEANQHERSADHLSGRITLLAQADELYTQSDERRQRNRSENGGRE
jgi:hypothetical protein